jgi:dynein heavy chain
MEFCKNNTFIFDATSPLCYTFKDPEDEKEYLKNFIKDANEYLWLPCTVLEYNPETQKYRIKFDIKGKSITKDVARLSLQFHGENRKEFEYRKSLCEQRREHVFEFNLFTIKYVDNVPREIVSELPSAWENKIVQKLRFNTKKLGNRFNDLFSIKNDSFLWQMRVVREDYLRQSKKCRILMEMEEPNNFLKFRLRSLVLRRFFRRIEIPKIGIKTLPSHKFGYLEKIRYLNSKSFYKDDKLTELRILFMKECEQLKKIRIVLHTLDETRLPLTITDFIKIRDYHNQRTEENVISICHYNLKNLIVERLEKHGYDFYKLNKEVYQNSEEKKVLQYFNMILRGKLNDLIDNSLNSFIGYFKLYRKCDYSTHSAFYTEAPNPLFVTRLKLNKDGKKTKKESVERKEVIAFDPPLNHFDTDLVRSLEHIKTVINKIQDLMSLSIMVTKLKESKVFELTEDYPKYKQVYDELKEIIKINKEEAKQVKNLFKNYENVLLYSPERYIKKFLESQGVDDREDQPFNVDLHKKLLDKLYEKINSLDNIDNEINLRMFRVMTEEIKNCIRDKLKDIQSKVVEKMKAFCDDRLKALEVEANKRQIILCEKPTDEDKYEELSNILKDTLKFVEDMKEDLAKVGMILQIIENNYYKADDIFRSLVKDKWKKPFEILSYFASGKDNLEDEKIILEVELFNRQKELKMNVDVLDNKFVEIQKIDSFFDGRKTDGFSANKNFDRIRDFNKELTDWIKYKNSIIKTMIILYPEKIDAINSGEEEVAGAEKIETINKDFQLYFNLWSEANEIMESYEGYIEKELKSIARTTQGTNEVFEFITRLEKVRQLNEDIAKKSQMEATLTKLTNEFRETIKEYDSYSWIVANLNSMYLKDDDWREIRTVMGRQDITSNFSLKKLKKECNIDAFRLDIEVIKSKATRRAAFTTQYKDIISLYQTLKLETVFKDGRYFIKAIDEKQMVLDDFINVLVNIASNPVTHTDLRLKNDTKAYIEKFKSIQMILEEIIKFQSAYLYLEPIFAAGSDIIRNLPAESKDFNSVNNFWKIQIDSLENNCSNLISEYVDKENSSTLRTLFETNNKVLTSVTKRLNDYLNTKRKSFPRFYFVSDEDLMKILAQSKDPTLIQPHISVCFEGINKVVFDSTNTIINGMLSGGGEEVNLVKKINVMDEGCKGNVEIWLGFLEDSMRKTMEASIKDCLADFYNRPKRINWIQEGHWPGQIVQIIDQIVWTRETETALLSGEPEALNEYIKKVKDDLVDIVDLVRGKISKALSITLSGLIIISVHNRDVLIEDLLKKNISSIEDFEWISQMRYYYSDKPQKGKKGETLCPLTVKMINACLNYGFEYLGNISRLVITPLTDRCFRTLFGAYQVKYGGAPEGPAGTGKTESVKDLSKCVGVMCNVYNCTEGLNIAGMSKFFKGLASSGLWCCFDEFNRIDTEVLSVIAQQITTIQDALRKGRPLFTFEESEEIVLRDTCAINITMNPSYSGRNDLPDNLKALFRPCAMMVANYYLIAQIKLFSFGFQTAPVLANKVVSSLKLSSEQLSTQSHYDFGMRSLNAILVAAGKLKKAHVSLPEDAIVLRALVDVNLPKFTQNDIPLFTGIIGDLFPITNILESDLSTLENALKEVCQSKNLQPNVNFIKKCLQLFETINVRHGLMVVGKAGTSKSMVIDVLDGAINMLKELPGFSVCKKVTLNPKSLLQKQLYGYIDISSKEWRKGLIQIKMTELVEMDKDVFKWLIFDGPVDTLWIENMNSLLDDNKKLCLEDSSSINLAENMNIIFEVDDLKEASPATVSRNGMVLCEHDTIDFKDLIQSYSNTLPTSAFDPKMVEHFKEVSMFLIYNLLEYIFQYCTFELPTDRLHLTKSFINVFECFLYDYRMKEEGKDTVALKLGELTNEKLENLIIFSAIIGLCGNLNKIEKFKEFLFDLIIGNDVNSDYHLGLKEWYSKKLSTKLHDLGNIFDYSFNFASNKWEKWTDIREKLKVSETMGFNDIVIPTPTTIKMDWLINMIVPSKKHLLITGNTGTGKTLTIVNTLSHYFENDMYTFMKICLTAQTSANQIQAIIEGKLQKGYKKFSPSNSRKGVIFIDDLNMPQREQFGAQPPIELLRQYMDYSGWYELFSDTKDFTHIKEVNFIGAMGSVASGRTISQRYMRHFIYMYAENYSQNNMVGIYSAVCDWFFLKTTKPSFSDKIVLFKDTLINSTIQLYLNVNNTFKATPNKCHYTFNLRDLSKVFQGICRADGLTLKDDGDLIKLWIHECERVFKDRLVDENDRSHYDSLITNVMRSVMKRSYESYNKEGSILFGSFMPFVYSDAEGNKKVIDKEKYYEYSNKQGLKEFIDERLTKYNIEAANKLEGSGPLNLVLFPYAIEHLVRICRIIATPNGNALLVGVGGSGRKSLTILATILNECAIQTNDNVNDMNVDQWRDHLRTNVIDVVLSSNGKQPLVFLISDTQINKEQFLEDINSMLNTGEIPNLIDSANLPQYKDNIPEDYKKNKKLTTDSEILSALTELCKATIHIVLCMSPIGESFRKRVLNLPSIVNCSTVDWFLPWPEEALSAVAKHYLHSIEVEDRYLNSIINICVDMQARVTRYAVRYEQELKRFYYVTPMSFIELLNLFKNLLKKRSEEMKKEIVRYENGLNTLEKSEQLVMTMSEQIEKKLTPELTEMKKICNEKMKELSILNEKLVIQEEEGTRSKEAAMEVEKAAREANETATITLNEIKKKQDHAQDLASNIPKDQVLLIQKYKVTPGLEIFAKCMCLLMLNNPHPKPTKTDPKKEGIREYFPYAVRNILYKSTLYKEFVDFKKKDLFNMPKSNMDELKAEIEKFEESIKDRDKNKLKLGNAEADGLYEIIKVYNELYYINLIYIPTKEKADDASKKFDESQATLKRITEELENTRRTKQQKEEEKLDLERQRDELNNKLILCKKRVEYGNTLVKSLANEKVEWKQRKDDLIEQSKTILGDILISSGIIAYLGAFTKAYRGEIVESWTELIRNDEIPLTISDNPMAIMQRVLGDSMKIEDWKMKKLPNDTFSVDNAIIMENSSRWPLLIDPQSQAFDWINETYSNRNEKELEISYKNKKGGQLTGSYHVIRPSMDNDEIMKKVGICVRSGFKLVFEGVGEQLPASLSALYRKDYIRESGAAYLSLSKNARYEVDEKNFKFFITTKLPKPHYLPEICVALTIVNFTVTEDGMEDQMLNFVIEREEARIETLRKTLIQKLNDFKIHKKKSEDNILEQLSANDDNEGSDNTILDNITLINTLRGSKEKSAEFAQELKKQETFQEEIKKKQAEYRPVANHVAQLFFTVSDLSNIEPVYQYSLNWYKDIFGTTIRHTSADTNITKDKKLDALKANFTQFLYNSICMSLFEKDKLVFSFLLYIKINMISMTLEDQLTYNKETRLLVTGGSGKEYDRPNPASAEDKQQTWLPDNAWNALLEISQCSKNFEGLGGSVESRLADWKRVITAANPLDEIFPEPFDKLEFFHKLLIARILRPDKVIPNLKKLIANKMGSYYVTPNEVDIFKAYTESKNNTPIFFILSPGADPLVKIEQLALKTGKDMQLNVKSLSLGQGQDAAARANIKLGIEQQMWIILQNCHLAKSFMGELEKIVEAIVPDVNSSFRLFLTALPSKNIPISIIQNSVKLTNEPPRGLKTSLASTYNSFDAMFYESCTGKQPVYKKFLYSLCFFHALILERRKYGPLGWNIPYEFSISDLAISRIQLVEFIKSYSQVPWGAIHYVIAEANYGGRVTDPADRKLINFILKDILNEDMLKTNFRFSGIKEFVLPVDGTYQEHLKFISELPEIETPAIFGLHDNANITYAINDTNSVFGSTLLTLPKLVSAKSGSSLSDDVKAKAQDVLNKLPEEFNIERIRKLHPTKHEESLNSVLHQELMRYNNLMSIVKSYMTKIIKVTIGEAPMTPDLEVIRDNIYDNKLPRVIEKVSYPSLKPFTSWVSDLVAKLKFMQNWVDKGIPNTFWISGFYFTQSFLTGILQNYARKVSFL